jgi:DNA polymerase III subunit gamma/tau
MLPPEGSRYKVYIIDEVHMLSTAAFNALLKSLEEPPPNTVFVLATTEVHKIPDTVLSRCQRHDLRALPLDVVASQLAAIAEAEGVAIELGALRLIARVSEGSMRDAQSLLDRVFSYSDGSISDDQIASILGVAGKKVFFEISRAVLARDPNRALDLLQRTFANAVEPAVFLRDFAAHWRELLLVQFCGLDAIARYGLDPSDVDEAQTQVGGISATDLQDLVDLAREGADAALRSVHPRYALESLLVRMATREPVEDLVRLVAGLTASPMKGGGQTSRRASRMEESPVSPNSSSRAADSSSITSAPIQADAPAHQSRPLIWKSFVAFVVESGGRIMGEHLKRLEVIEFAPGTLRANGQEFSVGSLGMPGTKEKLDRLLADYSGIPDWRVILTRLEGGGSEPAAGSLLGRQQAQEHKSRASKEAEIREHPAVAIVQEVFPGSTVEKIEQQK